MAKAEYKSAVRSRRLICEALVDLLTEKPLDKITVTDIVRRAELNRGTFYAHYTDVPDVINYLIRQTFSRILEAISGEKRSLQEIPGVILELIQNILQEDMEFYRKVMNSGAASLMEEQLVQAVVDYMIDNEKEFAFIDHDQYIFTIRFCAGGLGNLYRDWFSGNFPITLDELTKKSEQILGTIISAAKQ